MLHTHTSRRKQLTFFDAFIGFPAKWRLRNERRNTTLMTCHYSDLARASDWLRQLYLGAQTIISTTRSGWWHFISVQFLRPICRSHFERKPIVGVAKCQRICQATDIRMSRYLRSYCFTDNLRWPYFALFPTTLITSTSIGISELCKLQKGFLAPLSFSFLKWGIVMIICRRTSLEDIDDEEDIEEYESEEDPDGEKEVCKICFRLRPLDCCDYLLIKKPSKCNPFPFLISEDSNPC